MSEAKADEETGPASVAPKRQRPQKSSRSTKRPRAELAAVSETVQRRGKRHKMEQEEIAGQPFDALLPADGHCAEPESRCLDEEAAGLSQSAASEQTEATGQLEVPHTRSAPPKRRSEVDILLSGGARSKAPKRKAVDLRGQTKAAARVAKLSSSRRPPCLRSAQRDEEPTGTLPTLECDRSEVRQLSPIAEQVEAEAPSMTAEVPPAEQMEAEAPTVTATLSPAEQMDVEAAAGTDSGPAELADAEATVSVADCMDEQIKTPVSAMQPHGTHTTAQQGLEQVQSMRRSASQSPAG